jgi:hypothetical protein
MRRDDEPAAPRLESREIAEAAHVFRAGVEVEEQDVLAFDRPLDALDQQETAVRGVWRKPRQVELLFMERDGQRVVSEGDGAIDQLERRMGHAVDRVVPRMGMKLHLQHVTELFYRIRAVGGAHARFRLQY